MKKMDDEFNIMTKSEFMEIGGAGILPVSPDFDGAAYRPELDKVRLTGQLKDVYELMRDGKWRSVQDISLLTRHPENSISAQLRNLRKERFGGYSVQREYRGNLSFYRVIAPGVQMELL